MLQSSKLLTTFAVLLSALFLLVPVLASSSSEEQTLLLKERIHPRAGVKPRVLITELGKAGWSYKTTPCDPSVLGSDEACYDYSIPAEGNTDYPWGHPMITYAVDGSPWGAHLSGPYPDGVSYVLTWFTGAATVSPNVSLPSDADLKKIPALAKLTWQKGSTVSTKTFSGSTIKYLRNYSDPEPQNMQYNYLSPYIHHVVLKNLVPNTNYSYILSSTDGSFVFSTSSANTNYSVSSAPNNSTPITRSINQYWFKTLPRKKTYPFRVGVVGDVGQTLNSTDTRNHLFNNNPQVILFVGDNSYADDYSADSPDDLTWDASNQNRWDSYAVLWEKMFSRVPLLNLVGNHDVEDYGVGAVINYTTTTFSYPQNYPFQAYSARYPVPGLYGDFGDINQNLYYSTIVGGMIKVIAMNNYVPFHPGSPQYNWAMKEFATYDRQKTPWLIVMYHSATYHTYYTHYKEMECFRSIWEPTFYKYRVDFVLNGHVHAYERTHPVYNYQPDICAPMYITIGDGGNVEGPYRDFVDQVNKYDSQNRTFCALLNYHGVGPNAMADSNPSGWGPSYQRIAFPPNCTTLTWQAASSVKGGPVLVPRIVNTTTGTAYLTSDNSTTTTLDNSTTLGFCQSSQPVWSAYRDPSFGHSIFEFLSDTEVRFWWYKNVGEGQQEVADSVLLQRSTACRLVSHSRRGRRGRALSSHELHARD
mmetsp:Transcript_4989/g.9209  ORF Transcript_4989/g.9209 Transcript_4989/m.9209 type:complete len:699 (-) Transcript_4989:168-2264(-)|eukprot:CAMPEP_0175042682 /NCGR_PEP_ID=MMETSP0052_2-20121109/2718_1 /TAXON_ID=51329 ORGANISM="Polytomella parva, Strain SAG 63-3" /NCGR_SAMPLE_ID=MMETSP0052_2 /ASSEMBLY_ACC=CAM_ASM_000194 /LENGTH=698 /DNA_ID=CAMNT_0016305559 /DNA_START=227 /DNA_END=2323 /DNA_ORIENTATION=+